MVDIEKTVAELKQGINNGSAIGSPDVVISADTATDILAVLLKEKSAEAEMEGDANTWWFACGECHGAIDPKDKYCRECGRKIIWT